MEVATTPRGGRRLEVPLADDDQSKEAILLAESKIPTCLEPDHVWNLEHTLDPKLYAKLVSPAFTEYCSEIFDRHDPDKSGYLEVTHETGSISAAVMEVLPDIFLERLEGVRAETCALSFDEDWDGRLDRKEFANFVRWAAAMKMRGFFNAQAPFTILNHGTGSRLLVVSEFMDEDGTLHEAVKDGVDLALYHPSAITLEEFSQQLTAAGKARKRKGLPPYQSVGLANHGPDEKGRWYPFAVKALRLSRKADADLIMPVLLGLAALLPEGGGGRVDLMACNLASVPGGMDLVRRLETECKHTVCASSDCTGNAQHGGNWTMEVGNVNVAPDYFDEDKLQHFERLMKCQTTKRPNGASHKSFNKSKTEDSGSDDDDE